MRLFILITCLSISCSTLSSIVESKQKNVPSTSINDATLKNSETATVGAKVAKIKVRNTTLTTSPKSTTETTKTSQKTSETSRSTSTTLTTITSPETTTSQATTTSTATNTTTKSQPANTTTITTQSTTRTSKTTTVTIPFTTSATPDGHRTLAEKVIGYVLLGLLVLLMLLAFAYVGYKRGLFNRCSNRFNRFNYETLEEYNAQQ